MKEVVDDYEGYAEWSLMEALEALRVELGAAKYRDWLLERVSEEDRRTLREFDHTRQLVMAFQHYHAGAVYGEA